MAVEELVREGEGVETEEAQKARRGRRPKSELGPKRLCLEIELILAGARSRQEDQKEIMALVESKVRELREML